MKARPSAHSELGVKSLNIARRMSRSGQGLGKFTSRMLTLNAQAINALSLQISGQ